MQNIFIVIDELGSLISKYKDEIKFKDYEIKRLHKKIESIESYINSCSDETIKKDIKI